MAYTARWDVYSSGTVSVGLDTVTKILGTGSLKFSVDNTASQVNLVPTLTGGLPQPATHGKVRQVIRPLSLGGGRVFGIATLQSARNITTSGTAYIAYLTGSILAIGKIAAGLSGAITILDSVAFPIVVGINYILEFEWNVDNVQLGGTDLYARVIGVPVSYSTADILDHLGFSVKLQKIDTSSPLLTTLGYGPIFITPGSPSTVDVRYDHTMIFAE